MKSYLYHGVFNVSPRTASGFADSHIAHSLPWTVAMSSFFTRKMVGSRWRKSNPASPRDSITYENGNS